MTITNIDLYFDGGCQPNPGYGYGSFELVFRDLLPAPVGMKPVKTFWSERMTNNIAEYKALLTGLFALKKKMRGELHGFDLSPGKVDLNIFGDSQIIVRQVIGGCRAKAPHLKELRDQVRAQLADYHEWNIKWLPRKKIYSRFGH